MDEEKIHKCAISENVVVHVFFFFIQIEKKYFFIFRYFLSYSSFHIFILMCCVQWKSFCRNEKKKMENSGKPTKSSSRVVRPCASIMICYNTWGPKNIVHSRRGLVGRKKNSLFHCEFLVYMWMIFLCACVCLSVSLCACVYLYVNRETAAASSFWVCVPGAACLHAAILRNITLEFLKNWTKCWYFFLTLCVIPILLYSSSRTIACAAVTAAAVASESGYVPPIHRRWLFWQRIENAICVHSLAAVIAKRSHRKWR